MNNVSATLCGALGGGAPLLLELAAMAKANQFPTGGFYVAMLILAFMGAMVTLMYREDVLHKAFFLGVSAPALVLAGTSASKHLNEEHAAAPAVAMEQSAPPTLGTLLLSLIPAAMAQTGIPAADGTAASNMSGTSKGTLLIPCVAENSNCSGRVVFETDQGNKVTAPLSVGETGLAEVDIPTGARAVSFVGTTDAAGTPVGINTAPVELLSSGTHGQVLTLTPQKTFWTGFFEAFGMNRRARATLSYTALVSKAVDVHFHGDITRKQIDSLRSSLSSHQFESPQAARDGGLSATEIVYDADKVGAEQEAKDLATLVQPILAGMGCQNIPKDIPQRAQAGAKLQLNVYSNCR